MVGYSHSTVIIGAAALMSGRRGLITTVYVSHLLLLSTTVGDNDWFGLISLNVSFMMDETLKTE